MKKIFTLIAVAAMAMSVNAQTDPVTYTFDNQASTYVLGDNCEASTYTMDNVEGFAVNYLTGNKEKMQVKLAANENIFFEYSNSSTANNALKTGVNFVQCDKKNYIIHIPVQTGDVIYVKFSAKGSAPTLTIDGSEPPVTLNEDAETTCSGKSEADAVLFSATATKGGTAKIKETANGMRVYAISINENPMTASIKSVNAGTLNHVIYNLAGQKVSEDYKGMVIKNGKKMMK